MADNGDAIAGAALFKAKCANCHTCHEGGPNKQGPSLYGVIGRQSGQAADYRYTVANKTSGVTWTTEALCNYLACPKKYIKGTNMAFPGFKNEKPRADIAAYLKSMATNPGATTRADTPVVIAVVIVGVLLLAWRARSK